MCCPVSFFPLEKRRSFFWVQHDVTHYFCEPWAFSVQQFPFNHSCTASGGPAAAGKAWRADTEVLGTPSSQPFLLLDTGKGYWDTHWRRWVQGSWDEEALREDEGRSGTQHGLALTGSSLTKMQVCVNPACRVSCILTKFRLNYAQIPVQLIWTNFCRMHVLWFCTDLLCLLEASRQQQNTLIPN